MPPARPSDTSSRPAIVAGALTTLVVTATLLWPAFGTGQLLYRDFVSVPDPALGARALGRDGLPPRAVPLDAVVAVLARVVPSGAIQAALLAGSFLLAGIGVSMLLRRHGWVATMVAAALTTWSPYAVERLLLGQPPTLLAWSALPWIVLAVRRAGPPGAWLARIALAAAPAALTPFGGVSAIAAALVVAGWGAPARRPPRQLLALAGLGVLWCLPWLASALAGASGRGTGDPDGALAFAVRPDGVLGLLDVLGGGGIWASGAVPGSRLTVGPVLLGLVSVGLALVAVGPAWRSLARSSSAPGRHEGAVDRGRHGSVARGREPVVDRPHAAGDFATSGASWTPADRVLAAASLLLPPTVVLLAGSELARPLVTAAQAVPGFALVRDGHRLLGLTAMTAAVLTGIFAAAVVRRGAVPVAVALAALGVAVGSVPDAAARLHAAYRPVAFPSGWTQVVAAAGERNVLVLPWQPFRQQQWAGDAPFLDPSPLALPGVVHLSGDLVVVRDGADVVVSDGPDPDGQAWAAGQIDPARLDALGIGAVLEWRGTPGTLPTDHPGLRLAVDTEQWRLWLRDATRG